MAEKKFLNDCNRRLLDAVAKLDAIEKPGVGALEKPVGLEKFQGHARNQDASSTFTKDDAETTAGEDQVNTNGNSKAVKLETMFVLF